MGDCFLSAVSIPCASSDYMHSKQIPSHLNPTRRLWGCRKAGEGNRLYGLCCNADLNQHRWLQDQGLEQWGRSRGLAADRCFPTKASSVSESKSLELQSLGLQKQQPIPGGGLASEVGHIWTTDMSLSDLRKVVQLPGDSVPFWGGEEQWQWQCYLAFSTDLCAHHRFSWACLHVCMFMHVSTHVCGDQRTTLGVNPQT